MQDILNKIDEIRGRALAELEAVGSPAELEPWRIRYLGSKGEVKNLHDFISQAQGADKKTVGQRVNPVKKEVEAAFEGKKAALMAGGDQSSSKDAIDVTEPGFRPRIGRTHVITQVTNELTELFARMGFTVATGPEMEDDFHNFIALNIPESHPARDPNDNFYLERSEGSEGSGFRGQGSGGRASPDTLNPEPRTLNPEPRTPNPEPRTLNPEPLPPNPEPRTPNPTYDQNLLLRTQTSTVQIRVMEKQKPPIRVVIPGKVYRPDTMDATHLPMFHQLEALVVDRDVTMIDLKSTILQFVHAYFGQETKVRFRPSFFPFTEPSAEVDVWFPDKGKWIELGAAAWCIRMCSRCWRSRG